MTIKKEEEAITITGELIDVIEKKGSAISGKECSQLLGFHSDICRSYSVLGIIGAVLVAAYLMVHLFRTTPEYPWKKAIILSEDGRYEFNVHDAVLLRFFSPDQVRNIVDGLNARADSFRGESLKRRRPLIDQVETWGEVYLNSQPLSVERGEVIIIKYFSEKILGIPNRDSAESISDDLLLSIELKGLVERMKNRSSSVFGEGKTEYESLSNQLQDLVKHEDENRALLVEEIDKLEPPLKFYWLYHEKSAGWLLEVIFWTLVGVLANTTIALILTYRQGKYDPRRFVTLYPKLVLAPILSIVVMAMISSGGTQSGFKFYNLPYLLVLSFALGFATESLYAKIRDVSVAIVGKATDFNENKISEPLEKADYPFLNPPPRQGEAPKNMSELRDRIASSASYILEKGIVIRLDEQASMKNAN